MVLKKGKVQLNAWIDKELFDKFNKIREYEERSSSNCAAVAIKHFVSWVDEEYKKRGINLFEK